MNRRKIFRQVVSMLFVVPIMLFAAVTHAEVYTGEGKYIMSEGENLGVAKERAKADAMRSACEKAGTYVKGYTKTNNFILTEDVIETITSNIIKLIEDPHFYPLAEVDNLEGVLIRVTIKAQVDDSDIINWLNKKEQEKSELVSQMEELRKANEEQERQIAELKRQLAQSTTKEEKEQITQKFADEDKLFLSNQKLDEATRSWQRGDYNSTIKLSNEALELNPNNALAYNRRGVAYCYHQQYEFAIREFNEAIRLNPNYEWAYYNRGFTYATGLKKYDWAIQDFTKALEFGEHEYIYNNRGCASSDLGQNERAIQDFNKAIELNTNYADAYNNRGIAYRNLKQNERAVQDFSKAIELNPSYYNAYINRGIAYFFLKQYDRAIQDYTRAIEINPSWFGAYSGRGSSYRQIGDNARAQADFDRARQLGYNG